MRPKVFTVTVRIGPPTDHDWHQEVYVTVRNCVALQLDHAGNPLFVEDHNYNRVYFTPPTRVPA